MNQLRASSRVLTATSHTKTHRPSLLLLQLSTRRFASTMEYTRCALAFRYLDSIAPANSLLSLGDSGLKISKVILGAMSYGSPDWQEWILDEEHSLPLLEHAYKVGLNTWDTVSRPLPFPSLHFLQLANDSSLASRLTSTPTAAPKKLSAKPLNNMTSPAKRS